MNRLQTTVCQRGLQALTMALLAVAIVGNSGGTEPADTFVPVALAPADELGLSVGPSPTLRQFGKKPGLTKENGLNPCLSPEGSVVALRTREQQQACYRGCVNRCWLRWMSRGHAGDRYQRYQLYLQCQNSCTWSCG